MCGAGVLRFNIKNVLIVGGGPLWVVGALGVGCVVGAPGVCMPEGDGAARELLAGRRLCRVGLVSPDCGWWR